MTLVICLLTVTPVFSAVTGRFVIFGLLSRVGLLFPTGGLVLLNGALGLDFDGVAGLYESCKDPRPPISGRFAGGLTFFVVGFALAVCGRGFTLLTVGGAAGARAEAGRFWRDFAGFGRELGPVVLVGRVESEEPTEAERCKVESDFDFFVLLDAVGRMYDGV